MQCLLSCRKNYTKYSTRVEGTIPSLKDPEDKITPGCKYVKSSILLHLYSETFTHTFNINYNMIALILFLSNVYVQVLLCTVYINIISMY